LVNKKNLFELFIASMTLAIVGSSVGCSSTTHEVVLADLGVPTSAQLMESVIDQPGPIALTSITSANWTIKRSEIINLQNPVAKQKALQDGQEQIQVYAHLVKHPTRGLFMIDTGVSKEFVANPSNVGVSWAVQKVMPIDEMQVQQPTSVLLQKAGGKLNGVLLSHLHLDHIAGLPDIEQNVPLYVGPNEATDVEWKYVVTAGSVDRLLKSRAPLRALKFSPDSDGKFSGVLDIFGDATFFAISSPGHTSGSLAFVIRTPSGPVLLTGDTCHSRWGWDNGVEPGSFISKDSANNLRSLLALKALVARHPAMTVKLGHQL
jgi:N-acyl homoserine lactone hydrolase